MFGMFSRDAKMDSADFGAKYRKNLEADRQEIGGKVQLYAELSEHFFN